MKKNILVFVILMSLCFLTSCDDKELKNNTENKQQAEIEKVTVDNFLGAGGYILQNQVYDYSQFGGEIYEYYDGIKLPIPPIEGAELKESEYKTPVFYNVSKEEMEAYINKLKEEGWEVYSHLKYEWVTEYEIYKDNYSIALQYYDYSESPEIDAQSQVLFFCFTGNVIKERAVTKDDARELIEDNKLLESNELYENYYVIEIESESVRKHGYYEFIILPVGWSWNVENLYVYYMVTDGKKVNLFADNILSTYYPTNANIIEKDDKIELVAITIVNYNPSSESRIESYIYTYELEDGLFVKKSSKNTHAKIRDDEAVITSLEDGEIKYYKLKRNEEMPLDNREMWIIDGEYDISNATEE